jgi:ParB/RepB/Spo0J family partition protein
MSGQLMEMEINDIVVKKRVRADLGDLTTLENSIRDVGLLFPLIVDRNKVLISGSRRLQACRNAGVSKVPVMKLDIEFDSMAALDIQAAENLCRQPLSGEELERQIEMKKGLIDKGILSGIKNMFGR